MLILRFFLNACFPAGPGCGGLATGTSQPTIQKSLSNEADLPCYCPVLGFCSLDGQFVHVVYMWWMWHDHASVGGCQLFACARRNLSCSLQRLHVLDVTRPVACRG